MRKLKLQMQMTVDGFVAGPQGDLDWMFDLDKQPMAFVHHLTDTSDTILLGRKMTPLFIQHWEGVLTKPEDHEYAFAKKMVAISKIAFSKTLRTLEGQNLRVENGDLVEAVTRLKEASGKDILVYGGANFASSLIQHNLIDELHFLINPVAIGEGLRIFHDRARLTLQSSTPYPSGIVVNTYTPATA